MSTAVQPRRRLKPPSYRKHATGQAFVTLNGKNVYLGVHGTPESREAYDRAIAEWYANGRQLLPRPQAARPLAISEVIAAFWLHAEGYYVGPDGKPTTELDNYRQALRPLDRLYGSQPAAHFGPLALAAVRQDMIERGWARKNINKQINRVRHVFKWAASRELIPASVPEALRTLDGLMPGRGGARETKPVKPAPQEYIDAMKPYVSRQVWALIQLQLLSGARPGELVVLRPTDIDMSGDVWTYKPESHKNAHHGHDRTIRFGPRAQEILREFLPGRPANAFLFSPAEAEAERLSKLHAQRKTPMSCGNVPGSNRVSRPERKPGDCYDVDSYRRAITRACELAFPPPEHLRPRTWMEGEGEQAKRRRETQKDFEARLTPEQREELAKWRQDHHWHPHQLRHNAATAYRRVAGIEHANIILNHKSLDMTAIYAEADEAKATELIRDIG